MNGTPTNTKASSSETAMRAMFHDRSNPDYIESEEAVKKINETLGRMPASEVKP